MSTFCLLFEHYSKLTLKFKPLSLFTDVEMVSIYISPIAFSLIVNSLSIKFTEDVI